MPARKRPRIAAQGRHVLGQELDISDEEYKPRTILSALSPSPVNVLISAAVHDWKRAGSSGVFSSTRTSGRSSATAAPRGCC